eukprot:450483_1
MVKWFLNRHVFELPWESVTNAWWQKYPNHHSLQVTEVDTIDRELDTSTGELITRRLISARLNPPSWMQAIGFPNYCYVLEETRVNPHIQNMVLKSVNVTGSDLLQIQETCKYFVDKSDNNKCVYEQSAAITSMVNIPLIHSAIESYSLGIHSGNAIKGLNAMEELCEKYVKLGQEGFHEILNLRLDTILLMSDLETLKNIDINEWKNLKFVQWTSGFANDLFNNVMH